MRPAEIDQRLAAAGYSLELTDKSRYLYHMAQRLMACNGWDALVTSYMTRLWLNAGIRKGRAYTLSELRQMAQPREQDDAFLHEMSQWVGGAIFKRGVRFKCDHCALEQTHSAEALRDPLICDGCQTPFILPLDAPFVFTPNPLFCTGMANGMLTMLRVLWRFTQDAPDGVWVGGVLIEKSGGPQVEVDLLYLAGDTFHMIEVKDALPETAALQMQLLHYKTLADEIDGVCTLAALPALPSELSAWCDDWGIAVLAG